MSRSKDRIEPFLEEIGKYWKLVPDWRFGQLMVNVLGSMDIDPFFPEEDKILEYFEKFFKTNGFKK